LDVAPRPSNYRSVLTYLKDHPDRYRKAINLVPRRLLSLYLVAFQSYLWNQIAGGYLECLLGSEAPLPTFEIFDMALPFYERLSLAQQEALDQKNIALPGHRAVYKEAPLRQAAQEVLEETGLRLNDLKARILRRAYLPKGHRSLLLHPADASIDSIHADEDYPGRQAARLSFSLPRGTYATLVLKRVAYGS
jgi:tRNA pseudouridine13 synthase